MNQTLLTQILLYNPNNGLFSWLKETKKIRVGQQAGYIHRDGYLRIKINNSLYRAHRLAWLYHYGEWPSNQIDHVNGIRIDNSINNLRNVSHSVNMQNIKGSHKSNKLQTLGVHLYKGRYKAQISINKTKIYLGLFDSPEEAHTAYLNAKRELHPGNLL